MAKIQPPYSSSARQRTKPDGPRLCSNDGECRFGLNELEVARTIINQATVALENARLFQSSVRTAERFAILNETSSQISALDPEEVYIAVHKAAERLMPLESFVISLLDVEKNEVDAVYLFDRGKRIRENVFHLDKGISSQVIQSGKTILVSTLEQANKWIPCKLVKKIRKPNPLWLFP